MTNLLKNINKNLEIMNPREHSTIPDMYIFYNVYKNKKYKAFENPCFKQNPRNPYEMTVNSILDRSVYIVERKHSYLYDFTTLCDYEDKAK